MKANQTAAAHLDSLLERIQSDAAARHRIKDWQQLVHWNIEDRDFFWRIDQGTITSCSDPGQRPDITLRCSEKTLQKIADRSLPLFIAIWATGEVEFDGTFADAYRLGYLFLNDKRKRRIIFVAHCWLNMNTRFPEGCSFAGANVPLIEMLLHNGLGIIQMPCPECICLGLEKEKWGVGSELEIRACFRNVAGGVVDQLQLYQSYGYEIVGILGMNPSPSCGVDVSKGKGTMLGINRDTTEASGPGVFIEEVKRLIEEKGIETPPIFGMRRTLPGETGLKEKIDELKQKLKN
ncbi:MAG: SCP2 sterol-binding domain-containing protein [Desulfobacterales bacterium]|jgi:predicted secreted protein/putative sterol carrier protein